MKKILVITNQFPNNYLPYSGVFNLQLLEKLQIYCAVEVISPLPWVIWGKYIRYARRLHPLSGSLGSIPVIWPVLFYIPKVGRIFNGLLTFLCILPAALTIRVRSRYDLIYSVSAYPDGFAAALLGKLLGLPVIIRINGGDINVTAQRAGYRKMTMWALENTCCIIAASTALRDTAVKMGVPGDKIRVIYNGVNLDIFYPGTPADRAGKQIIFVGNLKKEKGLSELVEALAIMKNREARLVIIGDGPFKNRLLHIIAKHGMTERVTVKGSLPHEEISGWLRGSDLLCLPSHNEGMPNVVLEALACGIPVVATCVGGIPELINTARIGTLVPPHNSRLLADALDEMLGKEWDRQALHNYIKKYSWENTAGMVWEEVTKALRIE